MTANPNQGVRLSRTGRFALTAAGRFALPLAVTLDGRDLGTARLVLTQEDAAALHAQLGHLLAESSPTPPDERSDT
ncbi:hypothetical protein GA0115251_11119 [Streptomyces sp. TverLS-915]|uniref:hypothetical protein n=1 Tax=Streptomyces sp. TverLS-915 TaxID=1839763 RepID=UPI00081F3DCF|nr:hypothetical protein [Streptomyces sp. TverLS-915]SCD53843.1 hypothetical protein GA0115251_11119 [Streptomyces sp. TverLS-915]